MAPVIQPKPSSRSPSPTAFYSCPNPSYSSSDSRNTEEEEKIQKEEENIKQPHTAASIQPTAFFSCRLQSFQCFLGPTAKPSSFSQLQYTSSFLKCGGHQRTLHTLHKIILKDTAIPFSNLLLLQPPRCSKPPKQSLRHMDAMLTLSSRLC